MKEQNEVKQEVSRPEIEGDRWNWFYVCDACHGHINWHDQECPHCKRRLDWSV